MRIIKDYWTMEDMDDELFMRKDSVVLDEEEYVDLKNRIVIDRLK
jgi:hypothetical protein